MMLVPPEESSSISGVALLRLVKRLRYIALKRCAGNRASCFQDKVLFGPIPEEFQQETAVDGS